MSAPPINNKQTKAPFNEEWPNSETASFWARLEVAMNLHGAVEERFCAKNPMVTLCLAAGKIRGDEACLTAHFKEQGWILLGPEKIKKELTAL